MIITLLVALGLLLGIAAVATAWILVHPPRLTPGRAMAMELPTDPQEAGFEFVTVPVRDAAGKKTIELWQVTGGNPAGPCVMILHGWGDSRIGAMALLPVVAPIASTVALYDQRGHGESPHPQCEWTEAEAEDLAAIVPQIPCKRNAPLVLLGASMGAAVALRAAAKLGDRVTALVLDSPFLHPTDAICGTLKLHRLPGVMLTKLAMLLLKRRCPAIVRTDTAELAMKVNCRVLVIHGKQDRVIRYSDAVRLIDQLPKCSLLWLAPQADHLQAASMWPQQYQQEIHSLLHPI